VLPVVLNAHIPPKQAAEVFNLTKPKLAVYNHIGNFPGPEYGVDYVGRTTTYYNGKIMPGEDLMTITIGDEVKVSD
jgi:ribonuclease Z